jgi:hypothetical protein
MQGVVKGVIGGGFESIGTIAGSLYGVVNQIAGAEDTRSGRADNIA